MIQKTTEKKLNLDIFKKSYLLDREILESLSNILINGIFEKSKNPLNSKKKIIEEKQIENFKMENKENFDKEEISKLIKNFNLVNEERKKFRLIIKKMLKKKFWLILKSEKKNENLFINKIKGINLEILKIRIEKFEKTQKNLLKSNREKNIEIENLNEIKKNLETKLQKSKKELKNFLLFDKKKKKV